MGGCLSLDRKSSNKTVSNRENAYKYELSSGNQNNFEQPPQMQVCGPVIGGPIIATSHLTGMPYQHQQTIVRALFSYDARHIDDLEFSKGDIMCIISDMSEAWWLALHMASKRQGYIPSNYVVIDDGSPRSHESWHDISHKEADKKLLRMGNPVGTYIIRPCSDPRHYALSVRHFDPLKNYYVVKHYKIRTLDNNQGYYISNRTKFANVNELITFYQTNTDGLCCKLAIPCPMRHKPPIQFKDIEVSRECIKLDRVLGNGSFGEVWLAKWNNSVEVAVKQLKPNAMDRSRFLAEAELMHKLNHPRIVQILGVCTQPEEQPMFIITELMANGALLTFLRGPEGQKLKLTEMLDMMGQVAEGMAYLESRNFVHRDLRAANILVDEDLSVKVADFGLARVVDDVYNADTGTKFPIKWTAPEAGMHRRFSIKSDVWSFGVLMYEIVTYGRTPYPATPNRQVLDDISKGYRLPNPAGGKVVCTDDIYAIMLKCWEALPENRPTFIHLQDIFAHWDITSESQYFG